MMEWISVKDRLPPNKTYVLCYNGIIYKKFYDDIFFDGDLYCYCPEGLIDNVTHWMPLPPPPQEKNELDKQHTSPLDMA